MHYQKSMKYVVLVIFTCVVFKAYSQSHKIGVQAGGSMTNVFHTSAFFDETDFKHGLQGGIHYQLIFENNISLMIDLLYVQKGFAYDFEYQSYNDDLEPYDGTSEYNFAYDFISLPVSIGYAFGDKFSVTPYLGIAVSRLIQAKHNYTLYDENSNKVDEGEENKYTVLPEYDWPVHGGLYFQYRVKEKIALFSKMQFAYSLNGFSRPQYFSESDMTHYGYGFSLVVSFKINTTHD
ncbi:MAG: outer membrane beta-barrel protein [Bacteroidales bacterium]